jgi:hypothetical protein
VIRTRQGSRVLIVRLVDSNNDGLAASLAIAFRRKRARLRLVAGRSLLVEAGLKVAAAILRGGRRRPRTLSHELGPSGRSRAFRDGAELHESRCESGVVVAAGRAGVAAGDHLAWFVIDAAAEMDLAPF